MAAYDSGLQALNSVWVPPPADRDPAANNFATWRDRPQCQGKSDEYVAQVAKRCYTNPEGLTAKQRMKCRQTCTLPDSTLPDSKPCKSCNGRGNTSRCTIL